MDIIGWFNEMLSKHPPAGWTAIALVLAAVTAIVMITNLIRGKILGAAIMAIVTVVLVGIAFSILDFVNW